MTNIIYSITLLRDLTFSVHISVFTCIFWKNKYKIQSYLDCPRIIRINKYIYYFFEIRLTSLIHPANDKFLYLSPFFLNSE